MTSKPSNAISTRASSSRCRCSAFTLLEIAVVITLISIVAAIAVPIAQKIVGRAQATALENDLRVFSAAFQNYANERGDWPPGDGTPAVLPENVNRHLVEAAWRRRTPIGGHYAWETNGLHQGSRYRAVITIVSTADNPVTSNRVQLLDIDRRIDDGDLETGAFLLGHRNHPVRVLER